VGDKEEGVNRYWMTLRQRGILETEKGPVDRTLWRTRFGKVYGPVARQTAEWMMNMLL